MTTHLIDFYLDGYVAVSYCKNCSAEGDKLFEDCQGVPIVNSPASHIQKDLDNLRDWLDSIKDNNYNGKY